MAIEFRGEEFIYVVETAIAGGTKLLRPFNQTGGSSEISADTIDLDTKDKTGSDYGKVTESLSLEGILTEGDALIDVMAATLRTKKLIKIYCVNTRDLSAESGLYMVSSFTREYSNGDFATYSMEATLNGAVKADKLDVLPPGAAEYEPPGPPQLYQKLAVTRTKWAQGHVDGSWAAGKLTFRSKHVVLTDASALNFTFANAYQDDDPVRLAALKPFTITCAFKVEGTADWIDITWDGGTAPKKTFQPGDVFTSDDIAVKIAADKAIILSVFYEGTIYPHALVSQVANGEGVRDGDKLKSETFAPIKQAIFSPLKIEATTENGAFESIACFGDSISLGASFGEEAYPPYPQGELGFMQLAALTSGRGYISLGMNGQNMTGFEPAKRFRRMDVATKADIALIDYGTNDVALTTRDITALKASYMEIWAALKAKGFRVYQTTIVPRTNSSDAWATVENQTEYNARTGFAPDSLRNQLNDWLLTKPSADLDGIVDIAKIVESAPKSGKWAPNTTPDGIHPNREMHILMAQETLKVIDGTGSNVPTPGQRNTLAKWNMAKQSGTKLNVVCSLDSLTANKGYVDTIRTSLQAELGNGGLGYVGLTAAAVAAEYGASTPFGNSGGTTKNNANFAPTTDDKYNPNLYAQDYATSGYLNFIDGGKNTFDRADLIYLKQPGGGTLSWGSGLNSTTIADMVSVNTDDPTKAIGVASYGRFGTFGGGHMQAKGITGPVRLFGVDIHNGTTGVRVHRLAQGGSQARQWAQLDEAAQVAFLKAIGCDLFILNSGMNDTAQTADVYEADIRKIVGTVRTANPNCAIIFLKMNETDTPSKNTKLSEFRARIDKVAGELNVAVLDAQKVIGTYAEAQAAGLMADGTHPTEAGQQLIARYVLDFVEQRQKRSSFVSPRQLVENKN